MAPAPDARPIVFVYVARLPSVPLQTEQCPTLLSVYVAGRCARGPLACAATLRPARAANSAETQTVLSPITDLAFAGPPRAIPPQGLLPRVSLARVALAATYLSATLQRIDA